MVLVYVVAGLLALSGLGTFGYYYMNDVYYKDESGQYQLSEMYDGRTYVKFFREGIECGAFKWNTTSKPPNAKLVTGEELERSLGNCKRFPLRKHPYIKAFKMYPGTKWCGRGNLAKNYTDLGTHRELDVCCRNHDMCPLVIHARVKKYGVQNTRFYTSTHCNCDDGLYSCLKGVGDNSANMVGNIYFNYLKVRCFTEYIDHDAAGKERYLVRFRGTRPF